MEKLITKKDIENLLKKNFSYDECSCEIGKYKIQIEYDDDAPEIFYESLPVQYPDIKLYFVNWYLFEDYGTQEWKNFIDEAKNQTEGLERGYLMHGFFTDIHSYEPAELEDLTHNEYKELLNMCQAKTYVEWISEYSHSGVTYYLGAYHGWDVDTIGLIGAPTKTVAQHLIEDINLCNNETFYRYSIRYKDELIDTIGGFAEEDLCDEIYNIINYHQKSLLKQRINKVKELIKHKVPITKRPKILLKY